MASYEYYIIEHPTRGVLRDLEETDSGNVGRFALEGMRNDPDLIRFYSGKEANAARARITPASKRIGCQIRAKVRDPKPNAVGYADAWPVVA